jgi:streptogramin lyase
LIADRSNQRIRRVDAVTGVITTVAGNGASGFSGDGGPATAANLSGPFGVAVDAAGNVLIADQNNARIRRVDAVTGVITTVAGNGAGGFSGDGGPATAASLSNPVGVAVDAAGNVLIADRSNQRIRRVDAVTGVITTAAGNGASGFSGDGGPATAASLSSPWGVAVDAAGNVLIADQSNSRIRRVDAVTGVITTVAGNGTFGFSGDGGPT